MYISLICTDFESIKIKYFLNSIGQTAKCNFLNELEIVIGSIRYRVEIRFVETYSKYASNNNGSITTQLDHNVVYVAVECMQGMNMKLIYKFVLLN